ncbi:hypothetical protein SAMN06296056_1011338 [Priestia filamentosa]|nr:hypothetical protein SAMN06296056_1011338 [Priestia filamentosa]
MKVVGVFLLMTGCLIGLSLGFDMLQGADIFQALYNA